jgi:hypothetical protein
MVSTQQMLTAINNMQPNAQAALPVIPNNGNPAGAYNMPQGSQPAAAPAAAPGLPWLQPSASMTMFQQQLASRQQMIDQERTKRFAPKPAQLPVQQPQPAVLPQGGVQTKPLQIAPPVLPEQGMNRMGAQAVIPQRNPMIRQIEQ